MIRRILFMLCAFLLLGVPLAMAQSGSGDLIGQFQDAFGSVIGLGLFALLAAEAIDKLGWHLQASAAQIRAIVVGLVLGNVGAYFHLGMFADPGACGSNAWYVCGSVVGLVAGFGANFAFTTPIGQWLLTFLKIRVPAGGSTAPQPTNVPGDPAAKTP